MNLYFLVEGDRTEKLVYRGWLRHALPTLSEVERADDLRDKNYFIVSGGGYPSYVDRIRDSLKDIGDNPAVDQFFVCVDSEELTFEDKVAEVRAEIAGAERETGIYTLPRGVRTHVVVQHCCIETWFLGNAKMMPPVPATEPLKQYALFYDVRSMDPERMACHAPFARRAHFHLAYLQAMLRGRGEHVRYSKTRPGPVVERHYYEALIARARRGHIASFGVLANILQELAEKR